MSKAGTHNRHFGRKYSRFGEDGYGQEVTAYSNMVGKHDKWDPDTATRTISGALVVSDGITGGVTGPVTGPVTVLKSTTPSTGLPAVATGYFRIFMTSTGAVVAKTSTGTIALG